MQEWDEADPEDRFHEGVVEQPVGLGGLHVRHLRVVQRIHRVLHLHPELHTAQKLQLCHDQQLGWDPNEHYLRNLLQVLY